VLRTRRFYYGPQGQEKTMWWDLRWSPATENVTINGKLMHALKGMPGMSVGCVMSNVAFDKSNQPAFPHTVYMAQFLKSIALIVDEIKNGSPSHCVVYAHSYGDIVDLNDVGELKKLAKDNPALVERDFTLRAYHSSEPGKKKSPKNTPEPKPATPKIMVAAVEKPDGENAPVARKKAPVHRGVLGRAVRYGQVDRGVAKQLSEMARR